MLGFVLRHVLRVPLYGNAEAVIGNFQCFYKTILAPCDCTQACSNAVHCLMVKTVDRGNVAVQDSG